jgi:hypothetical protein
MDKHLELEEETLINRFKALRALEAECSGVLPQGSIDYCHMAFENFRRWDEYLELVKENARDVAKKIIDEHEANPETDMSDDLFLARGYLDLNVPTKEQVEEVERLASTVSLQETVELSAAAPEETVEHSADAPEETEHNAVSSEETVECDSVASKKTV